MQCKLCIKFLYKEHFNWHIYFSFFFCCIVYLFEGHFGRNKSPYYCFQPTTNNSSQSLIAVCVGWGDMVDVTSMWIDFELFKVIWIKGLLDEGIYMLIDLCVRNVSFQMLRFRWNLVETENKAIFYGTSTIFFPVVHLSTYTVIVSYQPNHFQIKFEKELKKLL